MARKPVAARRPAALPAHEQEAGVLARAVVPDPLGPPTLLRPALELVLAHTGAVEQPANGAELRRLRPMRRARDGELGVVEVEAEARKRQRLEQLRRGAEEGDEG